jgi:hypothetical protein
MVHVILLAPPNAEHLRRGTHLWLLETFSPEFSTSKIARDTENKTLQDCLYLIWELYSWGRKYNQDCISMAMVTIRLIVQSINLVQDIIRHLLSVLTSPLMHLGHANCLTACRCKVLMEISNCILSIIRPWIRLTESVRPWRSINHDASSLAVVLMGYGVLLECSSGEICPDVATHE